MPPRAKTSQLRARWPWVAAGVGIVVLGVMLMVWRMSESTEDLLALQSPTPQQIRKIAVRLLVDPDLAIRARATAKLSGLGDKAKPVLRELASETSDEALRVAVLGVLRVLDSTAAAEVVVRMIQNPKVEVRQQAVHLAADISDAKATTALEQALADSDPGVRSAAAASLDPRSSASVRSAAAASLDPRSSASAASKLRAALNDPDYNVRRHAARSLRLLQTPKSR
jgi:HEAT repeat protein